MDSSLRQRLVSLVIADAIVRHPNDVESLFREGVLTAGPPCTVVLREPDVVIELPLTAQDSFQELLEDLRKRLPGRKVRDWEVQEQLLLALARVAAGSTRPSSIEALASRLLAGQPVVSVSELDGLEWLGPPIRLSEGVILGRISDGLEALLRDEVVATASPTFTLIPEFYHPITEDFQGDRVDPPGPDDDYVGNYPVVLCLATSDRSPDNNALALQRLTAVLGAALWLFSPRDRGFARPGARDYVLDTEREYASQHDCLIWAGEGWDSAPQDEIRQKIAAEDLLAGPAGTVIALAAHTTADPRDAVAELTFAALRAMASACDQLDPYDRVLMLVVALECLVVNDEHAALLTSFIKQISNLAAGTTTAKNLRLLYDARSTLAHTGVLTDKQEAALQRLTREVALPCLAASLTKLAELHESGVTTKSALLAWHEEQAE